MSVHDLARAASADLRAHTVADVEAGLDALFVAHTQHRRHARIAVALAVGAAVLVGWWAMTGPGRQPSRLEPTGPSTGPTSLPLVPQSNGACHSARVKCLGDRTYRFGLTSPVRWRIPRGYGVSSGIGPTSNMVESYATNEAGGITVMEGVRAASRRSGPAAGVPGTAEGFVRWLAQRPYLDATPVRRTTLGVHDAWHVRVSLRPGVAPGLGLCNSTPCHPITYQDDGITGIWSDMTADYTAFDSPTAGTVVVWSWAFGNGNTRILHHQQRLIGGISWPTP